MNKVRFYKNTKSILDNLEIEDGQILYSTDTKEHFIDHNNERIKFTPDIPQIPDIPKNTDELPQGLTNLYDKTVSLNAGSGINITGSYPDFTIENTAQGSSSQTNAFYSSSNYCVLLGNVDAEGKPKLFDEDLSFFVSVENPLVIAFANGYTKVFTSLQNADDFMPPVMSNNQDNVDYSTYIVIDDYGHIDIWEKTLTYYYIADCTPLPNPTEYGILIDISGEIPISKVWDKANSRFVEKNVYVLGEHIFKKENGVVTNKAITYPYNQNCFSTTEAAKTQTFIKEVKDTNLYLDYRYPVYHLGSFSADTTIKIYPPTMGRIFSTPEKRYWQEYTLILQVTSDTPITITFTSEYDTPLFQCGQDAGLVGKGIYIIKLYKDSGSSVYWRDVKPLQEDLPEPLPPVDVKPQPENPFV